MKPKFEASFGYIIYQNKLLLLLRDNTDIPNPNCWSMIGGTPEGDETPEQAFLREAEEEIGISPKSWKFLYKRSDKEIYVFKAELDDEEIKLVTKGEEGQKLQFFNYEELINLPNPSPSLKSHYIPKFKELLEEII